MIRRFIFSTTLFLYVGAFAQNLPTKADSLRGSITPERTWWDLVFYDLSLSPDIKDSTLKGENTIVFKTLTTGDRMQVDLQPPMRIDKVMQGSKELRYTRYGNVYIIETLPTKKGSLNEIKVNFSGKPHISTNPPWNGGLTWTSDSLGNPLVATTCQGVGASLWWPCKDHGYDEPDSMQISIAVPTGLTAVSNGRMRSQKTIGKRDHFIWFVANPINNYAVTMNIGKYAHFSEIHSGISGPLTCDYYVLPHHLEKAREQFKQVPMLLEAFEARFGPYPFYEDGFKVVEVPYLGMEHQSAVSYGNGFTNGYRNTDLSESGWGMKFDFILIHESGHEWFGNSISVKDAADMWIHEGFTCYSESVYLEHHFGKEAAFLYIQGLRKRIKNEEPMIGPYGVNHSTSVDVYYKGANMLHTLRQVVDEDEKWFEMLRAINKEFYHKNTDSKEMEAFIASYLGMNLDAFFRQYLRDTRIPLLEYSLENDVLRYRWAQCVDGFDMPVVVFVGDAPLRLSPRNDWQEMKVAEGELTLAPDFYVAAIRVK